MAIFHLSVKTISRSAGRTATAAAAYRAGVEITDERTGDVHDYRRKSGIESAELVLPAEAPEWASNRNALWNAAEQAETRKNSTVAREFEIALPAELSAGDRQRLARDFAREIVDRHGCVADVCIHAPDRGGDNRNHHAHILLTTRRLKASRFTEKTRELDDRKTKEVDRWRERFASLQNERLREAGKLVQVDHRSLEAQGIEREPLKHLGPTATAVERRTGEPSRRRLDFEADAAQRLIRAREAGELERQQKALDSSILDLSGNLQEAKRQRAQQQIQAIQEQARQAERQRLERMSSIELRAEVARLRPLPVPDMVERDLSVIAAQQQVQALKEQIERARAVEVQAQREAAIWRQAHPLRAKLHDSGIAASSFLETKQQDIAEARKSGQLAAPQFTRAEIEADFVRSVARDRVVIDTAPARTRANELEKLAQEKARQEREKALQENAEEEQKTELAKAIVLAAKLQRERRLKAENPSFHRVLEFIGSIPGNDTFRRDQMRRKLDDPQNKKLMLLVVQHVLPQMEEHLVRGRQHDRGISR